MQFQSRLQPLESAIHKPRDFLFELFQRGLKRPVCRALEFQGRGRRAIAYCANIAL